MTLINAFAFNTCLAIAAQSECMPTHRCHPVNFAFYVTTLYLIEKGNFYLCVSCVTYMLNILCKIQLIIKRFMTGNVLLWPFAIVLD